MATPPEIQQMYAFVGQQAPETVPQDFDFTVIKDQPFLLKLDVGASSYYSEIAAMQTLDNLLQNGQINIAQYLERVPDSYVPGRMKLISEIRQQMEEQKIMEAMMTGLPPEMAGMGMGAEQPPQAGTAQPVTGEMQPIAAALQQEPEITGGRGYRAAAREINGDA